MNERNERKDMNQATGEEPLLSPLLGDKEIGKIPKNILNFNSIDRKHILFETVHIHGKLNFTIVAKNLSIAMYP